MQEKRGKGMKAESNVLYSPIPIEDFMAVVGVDDSGGATVTGTKFV